LRLFVSVLWFTMVINDMISRELNIVLTFEAQIRKGNYNKTLL